MSFDDIQNNIESLGLGEFFKFCADFEIPAQKYILKKAYLANSKTNRNLFLDEFKVAVVELFRSDQPQHETLTQRIQQRNKQMAKTNLDESQSNQTNREKARSRLDSFEVGLESEHTVITTRAQTKLNHTLDISNRVSEKYSTKVVPQAQIKKDYKQIGGKGGDPRKKKLIALESTNQKLNKTVESDLQKDGALKLPEISQVPTPIKKQPVLDVFNTSAPIRDISQNLVRRDHKVSPSDDQITPSIQDRPLVNRFHVPEESKDIDHLTPEQKLNKYTDSVDPVQKEEALIKDAVIKASDHLSLDDPQTYRDKSKGFVHKFSSPIKGQSKSRYKLRSNIQEQLDRIKKDREMNLKSLEDKKRKQFSKLDYVDTGSEIGVKLYLEKQSKIQVKRERKKLKSMIGYSPNNTKYDL